MSLNQVAASVTSMLLILVIAIAALVTLHGTKGFLVDLAKAPEHCYDDVRIVMLTLHDDQTVDMNRNYVFIDMNELRLKLRELYKTRAERVLYLKADPDVPYQAFVGLIDVVRPEVDLVSLITPQVEEQVRIHDCLSPGCGACQRLQRPWFTGVREGN